MLRNFSSSTASRIATADRNDPGARDSNCATRFKSQRLISNSLGSWSRVFAFACALGGVKSHNGSRIVGKT
eukprot:10724833-Lingulodinium_polyedra.AAC.1